jgi:hypothetical protein
MEWLATNYCDTGEFMNYHSWDKTVCIVAYGTDDTATVFNSIQQLYIFHSVRYN